MLGTGELQLIIHLSDAHGVEETCSDQVTPDIAVKIVRTGDFSSDKRDRTREEDIKHEPQNPGILQDDRRKHEPNEEHEKDKRDGHQGLRSQKRPIR